MFCDWPQTPTEAILIGVLTTTHSQNSKSTHRLLKLGTLALESRSSTESMNKQRPLKEAWNLFKL